mgnify:CR=1 FL=1
MEKDEKKIVVPSYTRTPRKPGVRQEMLDGLPKEIEEYIINEEDTCSKCGSALKVIGKEVVRTEVEFKPARLIVKQIVRQIAKCTKCGTLYHVDCSSLLQIGEHLKEHHNFIIDHTKTVFYGICEKCH